MRSVPVTEAGELVVHFYADDEVRFEHPCRSLTDDDYLVTAPLLRTDEPNGHRVTHERPLTITPSILCPDCGTHGFVTKGLWRSC